MLKKLIFTIFSLKSIIKQNSKISIIEGKPFMRMLKENKNWLNLIIIVISWSITGFSYYWVAFYVKYFKGSIYVNSFLFGLAEIIGVFIFALLIRRFNNKVLFIFLFIFTAIASLWYCLLKRNTRLVPILIFLMVIGLSMLLFQLLLLWNSIQNEGVLNLKHLFKITYNPCSDLSGDVQ